MWLAEHLRFSAREMTMAATGFQAADLVEEPAIGSGTCPTGGSSLGSGAQASGRYCIRGLLGAGGMGLVYEATHLGLDTTVAIKLLRPELVEIDEHVARFLNEARCLAALSSDHVVRIIDAGWLETGVPFLVMERLAGMNLGALVHACGRLAAPVAVDYALEACAGLAEAHSLDLLHCDIKPANLFLASRRCGPPRIKLLDFGIARWIRTAARDQDVSFGEDPQLLGSPAYCSPEQLEGGDQLDERTDIWSLGLVLFEMLTGTCPFSQSSLAGIRARILHERRVHVRDLRPELDPRLAAIVECCLERDADRRFQSVQDLGDALMPFASKPRNEFFSVR